MKRIIELNFVLIFFLITLLPILIISISIKLTSIGNILHWSKRIGKDNKIFLMPKFRTMVNQVPNVATHLLQNPDQYVTRIGKILRNLSLDELPQSNTNTVSKEST